LILSGGVGSDEIFRTLKLTKGIVGQAIESVKEIADNLHPVILSRFGLVATINNIIEGLEDSRLIRFGFSHCDFHPLKDRNLELTVYRIINELINNTMKHARAKNVAISLLSEENHLILEYVDDGIGFDFGELPKTTGGGRGIENIIGRVKAVNGKYSFKTKPKKGLIVWIEIPILQSQK
jgi:signal transduction histidine kinase